MEKNNHYECTFLHKQIANNKFLATRKDFVTSSQKRKILFGIKRKRIYLYICANIFRQNITHYSLERKRKARSEIVMSKEI